MTFHTHLRPPRSAVWTMNFGFTRRPRAVTANWCLIPEGAAGWLNLACQTARLQRGTFKAGEFRSLRRGEVLPRPARHCRAAAGVLTGLVCWHVHDRDVLAAFIMFGVVIWLKMRRHFEAVQTTTIGLHRHERPAERQRPDPTTTPSADRHGTITLATSRCRREALWPALAPTREACCRRHRLCACRPFHRPLGDMRRVYRSSPAGDSSGLPLHICLLPAPRHDPTTGDSCTQAENGRSRSCGWRLSPGFQPNRRMAKSS